MLREQVSHLVVAVRLAKEGLPPIMEQLKNTTIPLNERWEVYTQLVKAGVLTRNDTYGDGELSVLGGDLTQYDHFMNDRGATVRFIDMYERIMDTVEQSYGDYDEDLATLAKNGQLEKWQEHVLARGFASFTYDW